MLTPLSCAIDSASASRALVSVTITCVPCVVRKRVRSTPSRARPITSARSGRETSDERKRNPQQAADHADEPEALRHLGFAPAHHLEVVVEWRHAKQASTAAELEVDHLQHDG